MGWNKHVMINNNGLITSTTPLEVCVHLSFKCNFIDTH